MFKGKSIYDFRAEFRSSDDCKRYLFELKWGDGYKCSKCGHEKSYTGRTKWYLKCANCAYDESVTANTLFHKMKVPILKAFEVLFMLSVRKKGMSSLEIGRTYGLNKDTAALLKKKAQIAMISSGKNKLKGSVFVDEFAVGGKEKNKQGRSSSSKKVKVVLACEVVTNKKGKITLGNAYAQVIEDYSTQSLRPIFTEKIDPKAKVTTDGWRSYNPISDNFKITQEKSIGGENFKELNTLTMLFKGWLRGIHHHVSKERMQNYIDEFFFRFNRKAFPTSSFSTLINRMMSHKPLTYSQGEESG